MHATFQTLLTQPLLKRLPDRLIQGLALGAAAAWLATASAVAAFETSARAAFVLDQTTGTILLDKNADEALPPASMSKLMTLNMVFEALDEGRLTLETKFTVSTKAAAKGGSTMFLSPGETVSVRNLIQGIIVQSGNDACIVVAEAIGGSEEAFADMMTDRAHELGLTSASFANATGWPDPDHRISALDLARLARILIEDHPDYYGIWSEREFTYNGIRQFNRNPLLGVFSGADGLKTGHTQESGYGLVGSAERDGERRIIVKQGRKPRRQMHIGFKGVNRRIGLVEPDGVHALPAMGAHIDEDLARIGPPAREQGELGFKRQPQGPTHKALHAGLGVHQRREPALPGADLGFDQHARLLHLQDANGEPSTPSYSRRRIFSVRAEPHQLAMKPSWHAWRSYSVRTQSRHSIADPAFL